MEFKFSNPLNISKENLIQNLKNGLGENIKVEIKTQVALNQNGTKTLVFSSETNELSQEKIKKMIEPFFLKSPSNAVATTQHEKQVNTGSNLANSAIGFTDAIIEKMDEKIAEVKTDFDSKIEICIKNEVKPVQEKIQQKETVDNSKYDALQQRIALLEGKNAQLETGLKSTSEVLSLVQSSLTSIKNKLNDKIDRKDIEDDIKQIEQSIAAAKKAAFETVKKTMIEAFSK